MQRLLVALACAAAGTACGAPVPTHLMPKYVSDVSFSPDGKKYLAVSGGKVEVFDTTTGKPLYAVEGEAARFTADGKKLSVMAAKILECDPDTGKALKTYDRPKTKVPWHRIAFAPDGTRFAAHFGPFAAIYDVATGTEAVKLADRFETAPAERIDDQVVEQVRWSPDGKRLLASGVLVNGGGRLGACWWEAETGEGLRSVSPGTVAKGPWLFAFAGKRVAHASNKGDIAIFDADPDRAASTHLGARRVVTALAFSNDGKRLAIGGRVPVPPRGAPGRDTEVKTHVRVIDVATKKTIKEFDGFDSAVLPVVALAFSPDGTKVIAGTGLPAFDELPKGAPKSGEVKVFNLDAAERAAPAPTPVGLLGKAAVPAGYGDV
jgi:WD40 repeat protein